MRLVTRYLSIFCCLVLGRRLMGAWLCLVPFGSLVAYPSDSFQGRAKVNRQWAYETKLSLDMQPREGYKYIILHSRTHVCEPRSIIGLKI